MIDRFSASRSAALLGCLAACSSLGIKAMDQPGVAAGPAVKAVSAASTDFGFRLLRELGQSRPTENIFFSPLSLSSALALTWNGAGGRTEQDMAKTLGLGAMSRDQVNQANGSLLPALAVPGSKVEVRIADALWAGRGITLTPAFQERCRRFYSARAESLDFGSPEAVSTVNHWVGDNTKGKITHLVTHTDLVSAPAVLTNAIYFHGLWQTPFDKAATRLAPFALAGGGTKRVPMMRQEGRFLYAETAKGQVISLPYGDGRIRLFVLLPKMGRPAEAMAQSLKTKTWPAQVAEMKPTNLTVFLPRFKAEYSGGLRGPLSALGMGSAFKPGADFRPMGLSGFYIGDVIHKAVLDVDEEGTTAAAATAAVMAAGAPLPPPAVMRVDHPFFLAVRDGFTGTVLFAGLIRDPR